MHLELNPRVGVGLANRLAVRFIATVKRTPLVSKSFKPCCDSCSPHPSLRMYTCATCRKVITARVQLDDSAYVLHELCHIIWPDSLNFGGPSEEWMSGMLAWEEEVVKQLCRTPATKPWMHLALNYVYEGQPGEFSRVMPPSLVATAQRTVRKHNLPDPWREDLFPKTLRYK